MIPRLFDLTYRYLFKPILFAFDPEAVHDTFTAIGKTLGNYPGTRKLTRYLFAYRHPSLTQTINGLIFTNPVGLSAGFDYDAKLTGIMPSVGFGFESAGTVTHQPYAGNPKPRLARLPRTRSLLVNKGFKSAGIHKVLDDYLQKPDPNFVLGLSIGATNSPQTSRSETQISDIIQAFQIAQNHPHYSLIDYLELNISCPNVLGAGSLADPTHLTTILRKLHRLKLQKPLWVKFPIHFKSDAQALKLVDIMVRHGVSAVVIGNLYKQRDPGSFDPQDFTAIKTLKGNFSGRPTWNLSNHLISLVYKKFGKKITIVGVGGIFTAADAYHKIKLGASLVQLITGMVYQGPQLIGDINRNLVHLHKKDGYSNLHQATGSAA